MKLGLEQADLVRQAQAGSAAAFARLVDSYRDGVRAVAYHYLGSLEDARDAVQETFIRAYLHLDRLREPERFGPWIRRIGASVCVDTLRRERSRLRVPLAEHTAATGNLDDQATARITLERALRRLGDKARLTVTLYHVSGYSQSEIASFLEVPVSTVKSRLQHARRQLREEMMSMMADVLGDGGQDHSLARRVIAEALERAGRARDAHAVGEAVRAYDEALDALPRVESPLERQRLRLTLMQDKARTARFALSPASGLELYEEALRAARELGDTAQQASLLLDIGHRHAGTGVMDRAREAFEQALWLVEESSDARGRAQCLHALAGLLLFEREPERARVALLEALHAHEAVGDTEQSVVCRAALGLLSEIGDRFEDVDTWSGACSVIETSAHSWRLGGEQGWSSSRGPLPVALELTGAFQQISQLGTFLDLDRTSWSGSVFSYSLRPLMARVTRAGEHVQVTVPAGTFSDCTQIDQVTTESDLPDDAPAASTRLNRGYLVGTRRAWFAPGIGLVRVHVTTHSREAVLELQKYEVRRGSRECLPLDVGNSWTYGWRDLPPDWAGCEVYTVAALKESRCYLECRHHGQQKCSS